MVSFTPLPGALGDHTVMRRVSRVVAAFGASNLHTLTASHCSRRSARSAGSRASCLFSTKSRPATSSTPLTPRQLLNHPFATTSLPQPLTLPNYDRAAIKAGIVHLGLGAFPRAHLAVYMDALLQTGRPETRDWGICGVGVREQDRSVSEAMKAQDCLYTVVARGLGGAAAVDVRVVGSVLEYIFAPDEPQRLLDRLLSPDTRIVSLTVTEGGYDVDKNHDIDADSTSYQHLQQRLNPSKKLSKFMTSWPTSVFGWIVLGLDGRRQLGLPPFSVMSMDNVHSNGHATKRCLLHVAQSLPELTAHIETQVVCPSSMVDRITPVTTPRDIAYVKEHYGIDDRWPLLPEHWVQWVVEEEPDRPFTHGRPPLELLSPATADDADDVPDRYNVLVVHDVAPYEHMKLRLLNASHTGICYLARLAGYELINEAMADESFMRHMARFMDDDVTPHLPPVPNIDLDLYKRALYERFANPSVRDTVARVCQNGADKWPRFLAPTVSAQLQQAQGGLGQGKLRHSALITAAWLRYLDGVDEEGAAIQIEDGTAEQLGLLKLAAENSATKGKSVSAKQLMQKAGEVVFGEACMHESFVNEVQRALDSLYNIGARATMERWINDGEHELAALKVR